MSCDALTFQLKKKREKGNMQIWEMEESEKGEIFGLALPLLFFL